MPEYPYKTVCANCGQEIFVHWSKKKQKEYPGNTIKSYENFHQCPNWKEIPGVDPPRPQQQSTAQATIQKVPQVTAKPTTFETADTVLKFERTFKVLEVTISKSRKCNEKTIPELIGFQSIDYFISMKAEVEINTDFQRLIREKFALMTQAIDQEIAADILRLSEEG